MKKQYKAPKRDILDFVDIVSKEIMRENMNSAITQADTCGISSMTTEDITSEVQAVRRNAKNYWESYKPIY